MKNLFSAFKNFLQDEDGLTAVEYAITGSLIALAALTAFADLQSAVVDKIDLLTSALVENGVDRTTTDCSTSVVDC